MKRVYSLSEMSSISFLFKSLLIVLRSHYRRAQERVPLIHQRLRPGYEYAPGLHVPQPVGQQPRYLAEGTDW